MTSSLRHTLEQTPNWKEDVRDQIGTKDGVYSPYEDNELCDNLGRR